MGKEKKSFLMRIIFWVLLMLFIISAVWWSFYLPYDEDALYRAIPPNAHIVSEHDNISERWQQMLGNNALKRSLRLLGDNSLSVDKLARDKSIKWMCDHFAFEKTLVAFVPVLGGNGSQAWIFSSWAGGNVQYLKRGIIAREMKELKKQRTEDGLVIWTVAKEYISDGNLSMSLAVYDGVLLGCLSEDPTAVRYLLYRMQGRILQTVKYFDSATGKLFTEKGIADRAWISKWFLKDITEYNDVRVGLKDIRATELQGKVYVENVMPSGSVVDESDSAVPVTCRDISRILKFKPELLTISNLKELSFSSELPIIKSLLKGIEPYRDSFADEAPVFVGLFGGNASGRIMGLRVPTIVVGVKAEEPAAVIANIDTILDTMNSEIGLGLIPNRMGVGETAKIGISSTRGGIYNSIKPAIKMVGDWLVLASNINALDNIITAESDMAVSAALCPLWMPEDENNPGSNFIWSELRPAGQCVRNALAVWSLSLSVSGDKNKVAKKNAIYQVREVIAALQELGDGTVWVKPLDGGVMVNFQLKD